MLHTLTCESSSLFKSIQYVLKRKLFWSQENKNIILKARSIQSLSSLMQTNQFLDEVQTLTLAENLYSQLIFLKENENKGFIQFQPEHVWLIDEIVFVYTNADDLYEIQEKNKVLLLDFPFFATPMLAKECLQINVIPSTVNWKCIIESLGYLLQNAFKYRDIQSPIKEFIERCINYQIFLYY